MWHPDVIHAVEDQDSAQLHPANVVYTAALPMCPLNARYVSPLHARYSLLFSLVFVNIYRAGTLFVRLCIISYFSFSPFLLSVILSDNEPRSSTASSRQISARVLQRKRALRHRTFV
jgi:hypothetical protein